MRIIKFRFWDKDNKIMGIGHDLLHIGNQFKEVYDEPKRFEVMQFTGLTDKLGKEIYEGDILKTIMKPEMIDVLWEVVWAKNEDGNMWGWMCKIKEEMYILDDSLQENGEVIGNIYEDSNLLKPNL